MLHGVVEVCLNFKGYRFSLVFSPADMRYGFPTLSALALHCVGIDISRRRDCVVFVSKNRTIAKMIWANDKGSFVLTPKLDQGRFQQILARIDAGEEMKLTGELLLKYLNGGSIQSVRTDYFQGVCPRSNNIQIVDFEENFLSEQPRNSCSPTRFKRL